MFNLYPSAGYCPICDNGVIDHGKGEIEVHAAWEGEEPWLARLADLGIEAFGEIPCSPECYIRWDC